MVQDPDLVALSSGKSVCQLRLAVDGMARGQETGYINVSSFGPPGEAAARTLTKGWLVAVDGRLEQQSWEKDGQKRSTYAVVGSVEFLAAPRVNGREQEAVQEAHAEADMEGERPSPSEPGSALAAERAATPMATAGGVGVDW